MSATNVEILTFIRDRLVNVHKENPNYDYMLNLQKVIDDLTPRPTPTPKQCDHDWDYTNYGRSCKRCGIYQDA